MPIIYDPKTQIFNLQTKNMSYIFGVLNSEHLIHLHYGRKISEVYCLEDLLSPTTRSFAAYYDEEHINISCDVLPMEYPCYGSNDLRSPAFHAQYEDGSTVTRLKYKGYRIFEGKKPLEGLPATYVEETSEAQSLEIELFDELTNLCVCLQYTLYEGQNVITRSVKVQNNGIQNVRLMRVLSSSVDFRNDEFDMITLSGTYAEERHIQKIPLFQGMQCVESKRGASSHFQNPFFALASKNANEEYGDVYGFSFVYSGNFMGGVEVDSFGTARGMMGINPFNFSWILKSEESFQSPEVVMVYSDEGFGGMSRTYHKLYRTRLCRGKFRDTVRPVLINNWEATYFNFNEDKILEIAQKAQSAGIEMVVLDDGWFGSRDNSECSLGDWVVNKSKLPGGIDGLAKKINAMGMKFGIWFEPEMVSPDSNLYRTHPDWCIGIKGRTQSLSRHQLILDLTREEVCDYIIKAVSDILKTAPISYVKWDMNRNMTEAGSGAIEVERQQEVPHRYILGLYRILDKLTKEFPYILFESCSGGGGRFDPGMLFYTPQIWTSDNTDAIERLYIQHGTSMVYPVSSMGAHVSAVPNHQTKRMTSMKMRGDVAMAGRFGYELDLSLLPREEMDDIRQQIIQYKSVENVIHHGDMYRLKSPFEGNEAAWEFISGDKNTVVVFYHQIMHRVNPRHTKICLKGIDPDGKYKEINTGAVYGGDHLMYFGLERIIFNDYYSEIIVLKKEGK